MHAEFRNSFLFVAVEELEVLFFEIAHGAALRIADHGRHQHIVSVCDAIGLETSLDHTPTRVFWERRLQVDENKGREVEKEDKEAANLRKAKMAR